MTDAPDIDLLRRFLDGTLEAGEAAAVERRIESDPAWQEALEEASGLPHLTSEFLRPARKAPAAHRTDAVLDLIDRLKSAPPAEPAEDLWKELLIPPPDPNPENLLGFLGDYEVLEIIATGGMGIVFKARDPALDRIVALKALSPRLASNQTSLDRFLREARAAAQLEHEHILPIYGVHEGTIDVAVPWFAMRYIDGGTLEDLMDRLDGPLPFEPLVSIARQIASALDAAHSNDIIHRDLKPSNILLDRGIGNRESGIGGTESEAIPDGLRGNESPISNHQPQIYLTDFGLARATDDPSLTYPGFVAGTPQYMAPEQVAGKEVDHRADLFGLGALLYHCATGQPPFGGKTSAAVMKEVAHVDPKLPTRFNATLPTWFRRLIRNLLAKNPAHRFPSAAAVVRAIDTRHAPRPHLVRNRKRLLAASLVVLLAALAFASVKIPTVAYKVNQLRATGERAFLNTHRLGVHDNLAAAIAHARPGDTIVIHSSERFPINETIVVPEYKPLTIRAAMDDFPVFWVTDSSLTAIVAHSSLVLDGLTVIRLHGDINEEPVIDLYEGNHHLRHCSLRTAVRRPRMLSHHPVVRLSTAGSLHLDHTILVPLGGMALSINDEAPPRDESPVEVTFTHTITCGNYGIGTSAHPDTRIRITLNNSALATSIGFSDRVRTELPYLEIISHRSILSNPFGLCWFGGEHLDEVKRKFRWSGRENLYFEGSAFLRLEARPTQQSPGVLATLDDWTAFSAVTEVDPRTSRFKDNISIFQRLGGDLSKYDAAPIADACRPHVADFPGTGPDLDRLGPEGRK